MSPAEAGSINKFSALFQPLSINGNSIRNRVVAIPHGQTTLEPNELFANLSALARLTVIMIILGGGLIPMLSAGQPLANGTRP